MNNLLLIFLGGGLGSMARYGISEFVRVKVQSAFPVATLCSNIISCLVLALTVGYVSEKIEVGASMKALILVGFCGGFSTFSTFSYETVNLFREGLVMYAIANIVVSVVACIAIVYFLSKN